MSAPCIRGEKAFPKAPTDTASSVSLDGIASHGHPGCKGCWKIAQLTFFRLCSNRQTRKELGMGIKCLLQWCAGNLDSNVFGELSFLRLTWMRKSHQWEPGSPTCISSAFFTLILVQALRTSMYRPSPIQSHSHACLHQLGTGIWNEPSGRPGWQTLPSTYLPCVLVIL